MLTGDNRVVQVRPRSRARHARVHYDRKPYGRVGPIRNDVFTTAENGHRRMDVLRRGGTNTRTRDVRSLFRRVCVTGVSLARVTYRGK